MKNQEIFFDCKIDFELIAVSANVKGYRMAWLLNKALKIDFCRQRDFEFSNPSAGRFSRHEIYLFEDHLNYLDYVLISNKDTGAILIPELKAADFLLMIRGSNAPMHLDDIYLKVRNAPEIQTDFKVDAEKIKSIENLLLI